MKVNTRIFGEIEVAEEKIITFDIGLMGFEDIHKYTLIFDEEDRGSIMWLQSLDEPELAFPVIDPLVVADTYNPIVEDEWLTPLGEVKSEADYFLLTVVTVPSDVKKTTANFKAPLVINMNTYKACQIIVNNDDYQIKYNLYDYFQRKKECN